MRDNAPAAVPAFRTQINDPVGTLNYFKVVFDDDNGMAFVDKRIDLGPEGGEKKGGFLVFEGTPEDMAKKGKGYTAEYLKKKLG